jgi:hypothetical protein
MENLGIFYDHLVFFTAVVNILGMAIWYFVPRKIWQPCCRLRCRFFCRHDICGVFFSKTGLEVKSGFARFFPEQDTKAGKMYQNNTSQSMQIGLNMYQTAVLYVHIKKKYSTKYTNIFHSKALQNIPKTGILGHEYLPSGNPGGNHALKKIS